MGICDSSNDKNQELLNSSKGPGIPPEQLIPQHVDVSNIASILNNQANNIDEQVNKLETVQNQEVNPINSAIVPVSAPPEASLNV